MGYSTIYGDSVGGFNPLKDVPKTLLWALSRWRNAEAERLGQTPPIPENSINKAPSAELRPGQTDQDTLPPYELLDAVLERYVEGAHGRSELLADGFAAETVDGVVTMVDRAEWKRRQSAPGPKISPVAFGRDRRLPITSRWREHESSRAGTTLTRHAPHPRGSPAAARPRGRRARGAPERCDGDHCGGCRGPQVADDNVSMTEQSEQPNPYGGRVVVPDAAAPGAVPPPRRTRVHHLRQLKERGERFAMLTAYDQYAAAIFEEAGIPVLLVGDSAANNVLGYETTVPVTVDELIPLVRAVTRSARYSLVVADLPFGSYQSGPEKALATSTRMMKEGLAHAVKLEGGARVAPSVEHIVGCRHPGDGPHRVHPAGRARTRRLPGAGPRRRRPAAGRRRPGARGSGRLRDRARDGAGPGRRRRSPRRSQIPTIGIGAGSECDGQVLVWQDMMGLRTGKAPRFVKRYADLHAVMLDAAKAYADDVRAGTFPAAEHSFES